MPIYRSNSTRNLLLLLIKVFFNRINFCLVLHQLHQFSNELMNSLVQGLPRVSAYLDEILVSGVDEEDHLNNLDKVL